jgi:hypothetical protein
MTPNATKLWAIHIPGPDDVWAMPSEDAARKAADEHNAAVRDRGMAARFQIDEDQLLAKVIEWPHTAESHAESMIDSGADVLEAPSAGSA